MAESRCPGTKACREDIIVLEGGSMNFLGGTVNVTL